MWNRDEYHPNTNYFFRIYKGYATPEPNINRSQTMTIRLRTPGNYFVLHSGWNLISIPYVQNNSSESITVTTDL